ncbi:hypothetical protein KP509_31G047000 [Ceratopteris richardii]|uniref:2-phosphoglycerate kinase n=1 Tax=Ceratopteris richardii TaxID=49495 RepID=A0A8T2QZG6_CERRI|nr:hypothetical protein KP509_31G047000 [Ceratopteris richardii]
MMIVTTVTLPDDEYHDGDGSISTTGDSKSDEASDAMRSKEGEDAVSGTPPLPAHSRHNSSKYDFVKVKVWLGDSANHYYVLSRFLVSRMLTVTKIPNHVAIKISLELKKLLVDNSLLDVSQSDLEANLFKLMERRGFGEEYINRYKMMTRFHHQRVPLVILVCGTACVGKSTVATQLAQRLNLPNVIQVYMVYELIRTSTDAPLSSEPIWEREFKSHEELLTEFARECRILRKGLNGDLKKAMKDGKPVIIEGIHLDPSIYLMDEDHVRNEANRAQVSSSAASVKVSMKDGKQANTMSTTARYDNVSKDMDPGAMKSERSSSSRSSIKSCSSGVPYDGQLRSVPEPFDDSKHGEGENSEIFIETGGSKVCSHNTPNEASIPHTMKQASRTTKPIVIPIVLKMDEFDHQTLLEEWIACKSYAAFVDEAKKDALIDRLMRIQDYLCSFKSQVEISGTTIQSIWHSSCTS